MGATGGNVLAPGPVIFLEEDGHTEQPTLMRRILSARYVEVLKDFVSGEVLLAFDFDGTLSPIVSSPGDARIRRSTRSLLKKLTAVYPCILISGRSRSDVRRRVRGIEFREVIGNHGIEPWDSSWALERRVQGWAPKLRKELRRFPGALLENKGFSLSVHYRKVGRKRELIASVERLVAKIPKAHLVGGKQVINLVPQGPGDKGVALKREMKKRNCDRAVYVGDDTTDESVFALPMGRRLLTIRVGRTRTSRARYFISSQRHIDRLLRVLIAARHAGRGRARLSLANSGAWD